MIIYAKPHCLNNPLPDEFSTSLQKLNLDKRSPEFLDNLKCLALICESDNNKKEGGRVI